MTDIVHVENLVKRYDDLIALDHFNLSIAPGEIFGLLGPNGSGKTTSINCILQLLAYDKGTIELFGEPMTPARYDLKRRIGVVPQQVAVFDELTVRENISLALTIQKKPTSEIPPMVDEMATRLGIAEILEQYPYQISGGQKQRAAAARAGITKPSLVLADEPTGALDYKTGKAILKLLQDTCRETGRTVVLITHNSAFCAIADRVIHVKEGKVERMELNAHPQAAETVEW